MIYFLDTAQYCIVRRPSRRHQSGNLRGKRTHPQGPKMDKHVSDWLGKLARGPGTNSLLLLA